MTQFERIVQFEPAFDRRNPNSKKDYGIHGVELRMYLKGPKGVTQFVLFTNWQLPHVTAELHGKSTDHLFCHPMPADLGYHSPTPLYEGQDAAGPCDVLDGGQECYYDGSGLNAQPVYERLLREGHAGVWAALEDYYYSRFGVTA